MRPFRRRTRSRQLLLGLACALATTLIVALPASAATDTRPLRWSRIAPPQMRDATPWAAVATRRGLLVVGAIGDPDSPGGRVAGVWTTRDGRTWRTIDLGLAGEGVSLRGVASWHGGLVAVGSRIVEDAGPYGGHRVAVAFTSRDGRTWRERTIALAEDAMLQSITVHRGMLVAGGCASSSLFGCLFGSQVRAAVWTSSDGATWTRLLLGEGQHAFVNSVRSTGTRLLAAGAQVEVWEDDEWGLVSSPVDLGIWRGATPSTLIRVRDLGEWPGEATDVVPFHGRDVVVGNDLIAMCAGVWRRDRATWALVDGVERPCGEAEEGAAMSAVVPFDGRLYAAGSSWGSPATLAVWSSGTGTRWRRVASAAFDTGEASAFAQDILVWRGSVVILGITSREWEDQGSGTIWIGRPPG